MKIKIYKSIANGVIKAISSKSYVHRILIASALTNERCIIDNVDLNDDILATLSCLETLGKKWEYHDRFILIETIKSFSELDDELIFLCGDSASTLRFIIPVALLTGKKLIFKCNEELIKRGIEAYEEIFVKHNINYSIIEKSIIIDGTLLSGIFEINNSKSSQYISGLLFALPLLKNDSKIVLKSHLVSKNYIDMTLDILSSFGIEIIKKDNELFIKGNQKYLQKNSFVEGDYSNAAILHFFNYLGGNVKVVGLNSNSLQGDKVFFDLFDKLKNNFQTIDLSNCIDLGPILCAFASLYHGGKFINTSRLKIKESNRVESIIKELKKFNISFLETENELVINKSHIAKPVETLLCHKDHRIAMTLIALLSKFGGTIDGVEAINKSYPTFLSDIKRLGIKYDILD